ncbi:uncharacterized protein LOC128682210 isoform X2 [Plodia interpunctella]|nr:uncharacterized protein LOC128682210 isoform X2 [Plodia interpunctella]
MRWLRRAADGRMRARVALELLRRHVPRGTAITKQMSKSLSAKCAELKPRCVRSQIFVLDISSGEWGGRRGPEDYCEASYLDDVKEEKADEVHDEEDMEGEACGDTIESANVTPQHGNEISHKKLYLEVKPLDVHYEADDAPEDRAERASNENDKPKLYLEVKPLNVSFKKISEIINCKNKNKAKKVVMKRQIVNRSNAMSKKSITEYARKANFDVRFLTIAEQKKEIEDKLNEVVTLGKKCGKCGKRFRDTNTLERHTKVYHVSRPGNLVCDICECVFNRRTLLKTHLDNHSWVFTCRECGFRTNQQGNMMPHWSFHAGKKFVCQFCNKEYQKRSTFLSHVKLKHSMELPWCRLCGEFSTSQKGVDIHMNVTHGALEEEFPEVCRHCDKRFKSDVALQRHAAVQGAFSELLPQPQGVGAQGAFSRQWSVMYKAVARVRPQQLRTMRRLVPGGDSAAAPSRAETLPARRPRTLRLRQLSRQVSQRECPRATLVRSVVRRVRRQRARRRDTRDTRARHSRHLPVRAVRKAVHELCLLQAPPHARAHAGLPSRAPRAPPHHGQWTEYFRTESSSRRRLACGRGVRSTTACRPTAATAPPTATTGRCSASARSAGRGTRRRCGSGCTSARTLPAISSRARSAAGSSPPSSTCRCTRTHTRARGPSRAQSAGRPSARTRGSTATSWCTRASASTCARCATSRSRRRPASRLTSGPRTCASPGRRAAGSGSPSSTTRLTRLTLTPSGTNVADISMLPINQI